MARCIGSHRRHVHPPEAGATYHAGWSRSLSRGEPRRGEAFYARRGPACRYDVTDVAIDAELFDDCGSNWNVNANALFVIVPARLGVTRTVTAAVAPAGIVPRSQSTTETSEMQLPWLLMVETTSTPAGSESMRPVPGAGLGPSFVTESV